MNTIGKSFIILESVDSTNNYAMGMVHAGLAKHGDAFFSRAQTAGKGQRGKSWKSGVGQNIILSCVVEPGVISITEPVQLSLAVAVSCYDFVNHHTVSNTSIKWPNDIYWRDRKAGGILIENRFKGGEWQYAVVGIGININQTVFSPDLINPVSLKQVTGSTYDTIEMAQELCGFIQERLALIGAQNILEVYNNHLYKNGERVLLKAKDKIFETAIKGVNKLGQLVTHDTSEEIFSWGEVEWIK